MNIVVDDQVLHHAVVSGIAEALHYIDVGVKACSDDRITATEWSERRYRQDSIFRARVQAIAMSVLREVSTIKQEWHKP